MEFSKVETLQHLYINYDSSSGKYSSSAKIIVLDHVVQIQYKYYPTLDEAVSGIKQRVCDAVIKFTKNLKENDVNPSN